MVQAAEHGADLVTVVGHKFGAPKGVAALYVREGTRIARMIHGGGQEMGRRAGTENVLLIAGLGRAAVRGNVAVPDAAVRSADGVEFVRIQEKWRMRNLPAQTGDTCRISSWRKNRIKMLSCTIAYAKVCVHIEAVLALSSLSEVLSV